MPDRFTARRRGPKQRIGSRVLLASGSPAIQGWWRQHLTEPEVEAVTRLADLRARMVVVRPSVLLVDLDLPGLGRTRGLLPLLQLVPETRIIALAQLSSSEEAMDVVKAGAHGYTVRETDGGVIPRAVEAVRKGELWVRRDVLLALLNELLPIHRANNAARHLSPGADARLRPLTPREREIAYLIAAGTRNKDIAASLQIAETTVKAHLTSIFRKLGTPDRLRLALRITHTDGLQEPLEAHGE